MGKEYLKISFFNLETYNRLCYTLAIVIAQKASSGHILKGETMTSQKKHDAPPTELIDKLASIVGQRMELGNNSSEVLSGLSTFLNLVAQILVRVMNKGQ